jgi:hypothetical protein
LGKTDTRGRRFEQSEKRQSRSKKSQLNAKRLVERLWVRPIHEEDVLSKAKNGSPEVKKAN